MARRLIGAIALAVLLSPPVTAQQYYAVLITGSPQSWNGDDSFWNDTYLMRTALLESGFASSRIYMLFSDGTASASNNPQYQDDHRVAIGAAYRENVVSVFSSLASQMTSNDVLLIFTYDHGNAQNGHSTLLLPQPGSGTFIEMTDQEFAVCVNQIHCGKKIILMGQCYSGGFIDDLQSSNTVIITACTSAQGSTPADDQSPDGGDQYENEHGIYENPAATNFGPVSPRMKLGAEGDRNVYHHFEFAYHLINAIRGRTPSNHGVNADADNNGAVSVAEAYNWVYNRDSQVAYETTQYSDPGGIGGSTFFIPNYVPPQLPPITVTVSGPTQVYHGQKGQPYNPQTWNANISGVTQPYSCAWYKIYDGYPGFQVGTGTSYTTTFGYDGGTYNIISWTLTATVTDGVHPSGSGSIRVTEYGSGFGGSGGGEEIFSPDSKRATSVPTEFAVGNYPNPFNPSTTISYQLVENAAVSLEIYDIMGRRVMSLIDAERLAGYHTVQWAGKDASGIPVSSGVFFYHFQAQPTSGHKAFVATGKLLLMK